MGNQSRALYMQLREAYREPEMRTYPEVQQILLTAGRKLDGNADGAVYTDAVVVLERDLASFYIAHHDLPESAAVIYAAIKGDVPEVLRGDTPVR